MNCGNDLFEGLEISSNLMDDCTGKVGDRGKNGFNNSCFIYMREASLTGNVK